MRFSQSINRELRLPLSILSRLERRFEHKPACLTGPAVDPPDQYLLPALAALICRPQRILLLWNWKAAWLSILLRGPIFLAVTAHRGLKVTLAAVATECFFCAVTAGFYGALIQSLRNAKPLWLTIVFLTVLVPSVFQVLEAYLHWVRGTPHLRIAEGVSIVVSAVSSLFNWYAMQRGTLLVGGEGRSFRSDLRQLPGLLLSFFVGLPRYIRERGKGSK